MTYIIISIVLFLAGFVFGIKYDEDKDIALLMGQPIRTWTAWAAFACWILSFAVYYGGSR